MKKVVKTVAIVLVFLLAVFTFLASGSDSDEQEIVSETSGGSATNQAAEKGEADWNVGEPNVNQWTDSINTSWVNVVVPVENTGTTNLYLSPCSVDLEDESGHLVKSLSLVSVYPQVLKPGETGVYFEGTTLDDNSLTNLKAIPHVKIEEAKIDPVRFEASDLSISDDKYGGIKVKGRVENITNEENSVSIAAILYNSENIILGACHTYSDAVAVGDKVGFEAGTFYLPDDITSADVARYEVYAYITQFQF